MANTEFFKEASKTDSKLGWKDIFSESFKKHSKADVERVLQVGTLARQVPESAMLKTWNRPWLWWPLAKLSLVLAVVLYAAYFTGASGSGVNMMILIPPFLVPIVVMVLMDVQLVRALSSITGGHILFCLPYATAAALHCEKGRLTLNSMGNVDFLTAFVMSMAIHGLWNSGLDLMIPLQLAGVFVLLYWIKRALKQMTQICGRSAGSSAGVPAAAHLCPQRIRTSRCTVKTAVSRGPSGRAADRISPSAGTGPGVPCATATE